MNNKLRNELRELLKKKCDCKIMVRDTAIYCEYRTKENIEIIQTTLNDYGFTGSSPTVVGGLYDFAIFYN